MSWSVIAAKEFDDAVRSKLLWGLVTVVALVMGLTSLVPLLIPEFDGSVLLGLGAATEFAAMLVPIVSLVAAYLAIAGERESGSLRLLLGLKPARGTVVLGKFVGRSGVVVAGVGIGVLIAGLLAFLVYGELPVATFGLIVLLTAALGVSFVGIAIGISAATATRARAMTLGIAVYLGLALLWDLVPQGAHLVVLGEFPSSTVPAWYILVEGLSPSGAYSALVTAVLSANNPAIPGAEALLGGPVPFYAQWWVFALVLAAWTTIPLVLGYLVFRRTDLN
ncbi:ABC transporter permease subunit [Haloferax sp. MBLA0076]|uniref:ABC transporter permease subunit n=1 Tax=Haloferax litoreum TaxID=2666140 RepID=A0A6A8GG60_9EURY|nr:MULTISPECIES: ABC transporter permease subunit [Haloferax]KAB1193805.1 ABC transporter permease subunit [Haloferax sp. CBA1148]MRX22344.1 ABC transporter permease subunit [Haloferax litoreum]